MHTPDAPVYDSGYEWWLMKEAKARNPDIKLYGLSWAFPYWIRDGYTDNSPYHDPALTADYTVRWVQAVNATYGLNVDYSEFADVIV